MDILNSTNLHKSNFAYCYYLEEYIMQQKSSLSLKDACDYVLYWAIEEGRSSAASLFEGTALQSNDRVRIEQILETIAKDGRIAPSSTEGIYERAKN